MNEAELLFTQILNWPRLSLYLNKDLTLDKDKSLLVSSVLRRRIYGEPLQYILGKAEFMGLEFKVNKNVFIPRPETEILVEATLKIVKLLNCQTVKLLDIGTGSGCIAVSFAKILPNVNITATDISKEVIEMAIENAKLNDVKVKFLISDLFSNYELRTMNYELIVSNPPYISCAQIKYLQPEIKSEPRLALDGGKDGLDFYRRIINQAGGYLKKDGFLILEMGFKQREAIEKIFQKSKNFKIIEIIKDYNNIDRVIVSRKYKS